MPSAITAYQQGDYPRALEACNEILRSSPAHGDALHLSGLILYEQRRLPQAQERLLKASQSLSADARVFYSLALVEAESNKIASALKHCEKALRLKPPALEANLLLARLYDEKGEYERARGYYKQAMQALPDHAEARFHLANLELHAGHPEAAIAHYLKLIEDNEQRPQIEYNLGLAYQSLDDYEKARHHLGRAHKMDPADADTLFALAKLAYGTGETNEGDALLEQTRAISPDHMPALQLQADVAMTRGDRELAISCLRHIASRQTQNVSSLHDLGNALLLYGDAQESSAFLQRALSLEPDNISIASDLARCLSIAGDKKGADTVFGNLLKKNRNRQIIIGKWASLLEKQNRLDDAKALLAEIDFNARSNADSEEAYLVRALIYRREKDLDAADSLLKRCEPNPDRKDAYSLNYHFEKLALLDAAQKYEQAFDVAQKANQIGSKLHQIHYDRETQRQVYSRYKNIFTADWSRSIASIQDTYPAKDPRPVFILGFPRSGTSLLEQILSAHPDIYAAGELPWLGHLFHGTTARFLGGTDPWWDALRQCKAPAKGIAAARDYYLCHLASCTTLAPRYITDKMPLNVNYLPLIHLLFPGARIIQMLRHPLDVCLSVYFTNFSTGNPFAWDLRDTASRLADITDWARHCRQQLCMPIHECRYENLVANPEDEIKKVLRYLELPWHAQCLDFHKSRRLATTASYEQVTQPLYTRSVARHHHYANQLAFLREELGDLIDKTDNGK